MTDPTNRYHILENSRAYEEALILARQLPDLYTPDVIFDLARHLNPDLPRESRRQIAAKAILVTRGRLREQKR